MSISRNHGRFMVWVLKYESCFKDTHRKMKVIVVGSRLGILRQLFSTLVFIPHRKKHAGETW
jgi:hypothetical protein